jgi:class 3 adenylate cyclase
MFCDLVDSTGIAAKLDAEEWRDLVGAYLDAASAAVTELAGALLPTQTPPRPEKGPIGQRVEPRITGPTHSVRLQGSCLVLSKPAIL